MTRHDRGRDVPCPGLGPPCKGSRQLMGQTGSSRLLERMNTIAALAALAAALLAGIAHLTFVDPDMWHGMALIRESLRIGRLLWEDHFAYTPTVYPVVHHEWGTGAILYFVATRAGSAGILTLKYLLAAAIAVGCVCCARRRGARFGVLCPLLPVAIFMSWIGFTTIRAQMFTLLLLTGLLYLLDRDREGRRWWVGPWLVIFLLWVNLHGGFAVGIVLFGAHVFEQMIRRQPVGHLVLVGLAMAVLIVVNPYGINYYAYLWHALRMDRSLITEWAPLWTVSLPIICVYVVSLMVVGYALYRAGVRNLPGLTLVLLTACAALRHQRHLSLYSVAWLCYVPWFVQQTKLGEFLTTRWARQRWGLLILWISVWAGATTSFLRQRPWHLPVPANEGEHQLGPYPVGAVMYLDQVDFRGNLMTPFSAGAYVTWKLGPEVKVSIDSRYEAAYPPGALAENIAFYGAADGWQQTLDRYPTDAVLVQEDAPLAGAMPEAERWARVYRDDVYEIYARPELALPSVDRRGETFVGTFP